jgi:hypothetical protein
MSETIQAINLKELEARACGLLPQIFYDYYGGADHCCARICNIFSSRLTLFSPRRSFRSVQELAAACLVRRRALRRR